MCLVINTVAAVNKDQSIIRSLTILLTDFVFFFHQQKTKESLPRQQLAIICLCRIVMIRDFHITDENGIGYYTGLMTACFAISQLLTGIPWGMLSDRIGRKPVILQGLIGSITSILLLGFSRSYVWALLSRSLCGLLQSTEW
ncbi:hypothetical protein A0J61_06879 [Choanephora cucurbitarum]|uniref:Major facilitator superfamily (MFS) profile domain-containing protein n=1 Tax=Choanephora cucurbitarum TaxID=101091 RepID=A0A1C7N7H7_9FUNG|nr:hypothetical protein A0J61_06879 [Choanephora cucurbitarum]